jgi:hypothetical protein
MAELKVTSPSNQVSWSFTLSTQGFITRFGVKGPFFYKQLLPGGKPYPSLYPERQISEYQYSLAEREFQRKIQNK